MLLHLAKMLPPEVVPDSTVRLIRPIYRHAVRYHSYRIEGFEHIPKQGPALIVFNHSLATYDIFLFGATVYLKTGRLISSLADRAIFKTPGLRQVAEHLGAVEGEQHMAHMLLDSGRLVGVAPGGMREALRSSKKKYQLDWQRRIGFARLAIDTQVPVILAACPAADDLYTVFGNPLTKNVYNHFRLPLPVAFGRGVLPRKVPLVHYVSEPIMPPKSNPKAFQALLIERMNALMDKHA